MNTLHLFSHQRTSEEFERRFTNQNTYSADISQFYYTFAAVN